MPTEKEIYNCSQQDLYSTLNSLWDNYTQDLPDFTAYKPGYTAAKGTAAKAAIKAAKDLPDEQARSGAAEQLRIKVVKKADVVIGDFLKTKGYINGIFTVDFRKANYEMAGQNYYRKATADDWESVSGMGTSLINYLNSNSVALQNAGVNMPATFPATALANVTAFETEYAAFKTASGTGIQTDLKIKANNACYLTARDMMDDASVVYRTNSAKADRYIFSRLLEKINPRVAGIRGMILNGATNIGELDVVIVLKQPDKPDVTVTSDENGKYEITGLLPGSYEVVISKAGFQTMTDTLVIKPGTVSRREFVIQVV